MTVMMDRQDENRDGRPSVDRLAQELADLRMQCSEQTARLEELREVNRELSALTQVTDKALETLDIRVLVGSLLERLKDIVKADTGMILLKDGDQLNVAASTGVGVAEMPGYSLPGGQAFARIVMSTDRPLYVEDVRKDPRITSPFIREQGIRTMLGVPLKYRGKVIGALYLQWFDVHGESEREIRLLDVTADRCAMAINNALLFEQVKAARDELEGKVRERTAELSDMLRDLNLEADVRKKTETNLRQARREIDFYFDLMGEDIGERDQEALTSLEKAVDRLNSAGMLAKDDLPLLAGAMHDIEGSVQITRNIRTLRETAAERQNLLMVDLREVLEEVVARFSGARGGEVKISLHMSRVCERLGCKVTATKLHREVYANIIRNAVERSSGPLAINVSLSQERESGENFCCVVVEDDGPGIPDDLKHRIFETGGLEIHEQRIEGLGLFVVRTLVESVGGTVRVEDRVPGHPAKGSRFVIMMPAKIASPVWGP